MLRQIQQEYTKERQRHIVTVVFGSAATTWSVFSYKLRYIVGFGLVENTAQLAVEQHDTPKQPDRWSHDLLGHVRFALMSE